MPRRPLLAALAISALSAPAAHAGQIVYRHEGTNTSDELRVMNEDGSGQRTWLDVFDSVPPSGGTRFTTGLEPQISADGRRVVFTTQTPVNYNPSNGLASGFGAQGVNLWQDGVVRRLSGPPAPSDTISTFESSGSPASDGRIYYAETAGSYSGNQIESTDGHLKVFGPDGNDQGTFTAACESIGLGVDGGPKPSPADPNLVVYSGCDDKATSRQAIYLGTNGGQQKLIHVAPMQTDGYESTAASPSWSPDGGRIVSIDSPGQGPYRIVTYAPDGNGAQTVLTAPAGVQLRTPVYVGGDRIAFEAVTGDAHDIYVAPASCACALSAATKLTSDGASSAPSWSPAGLVEPAPVVTPPATAPASAPPVATPTGTTPTPAKTPAALSKLRSAKATRGFALKITLARAASVRITVTGTKPKRKARRTTRKLKAGTTTVKLRTVAGKRLAKGSYRVTVGVSGGPSKSVDVRVRR